LFFFSVQPFHTPLIGQNSVERPDRWPGQTDVNLGICRAYTCLTGV
jgi:hypothetical protein